MNNYQLESLASILAAATRVEGMKAANQLNAARGDTTVAYTEDHFQTEASHLEYLANRALTLPE